MNGLSTCIPRRWVRAPEDDRPGVLRYRAEDGGLPLSRVPRTVLELSAAGRVTHLVPGPADARVPRTGSWRESGDRQMTFSWDDGGPDTVVDVAECTSTVLGIAVRSGSLDAQPATGRADAPVLDRRPTPDLATCLTGRWFRAPQDDSGGVLRYRAADPTPPLSQAPRPLLELAAERRLFSISDGGQGAIPRPGRWDPSGSTVTIRWDDGGPETVLDVIDCTDAMLGIRIIGGSLD